MRFAFAAGRAAMVLFAVAACSPEATTLLPEDDASAVDAKADVTLLPDGWTPADAGADVVNDAIPEAATDAGVDAGPHFCKTNAPLDCSPGSGTGTGNECADGPSCYVSNVQKAVQSVIAAHPSWFDYNNQWSCPNILQVDDFMNAVAASLVGQGLCAIRDPNAPGEEVTVKHDNGFSENFDIVASTGCARYGSAIYTGWCAPAWW